MAITKRSIGSSISNSVSAVGAGIEALSTVVEKVSAQLPNGVGRLGNTLSQSMDIIDLYQLNWYEDKATEIVKNRIERNVELEQLKQQATANGMDFNDLTKGLRI